MAAILNLFFPGLGHMAIGHPFQGIIWFALVAVGYLAMVIPGIVLHIFCIADGARLSRKDQITAIQKGMERAMKAKK